MPDPGKNRYANIFSASRLPQLFVDPDQGRIEDANRAACDFYGFQLSELKSKTIHDLVSPFDDTSSPDDLFRKPLPQRHVLRHQPASGEIRTVEIYAERIKINGRDFLYLITHDITEHKRRENQLRKNEERFRALAQSAHDAIISVNRDGIITFWNKGAGKIFGYRPDEIIGRPLISLIPKKYWGIHRKGLERISSTGQPVEFPGLKKNGNEFPMEISVAAGVVSDEAFFTGIIRDITERKRREEEPRMAASVCEVLPEALMVIDEHYKVINVNPSFTRITGYEAGEIIGQDMAVMLEGDQAVTGELISRNLFSSGRWDGELTLRRKNGQVYPAYLSLTAIRDPKEKIVKYCGVFNDITNRKKAEELIRKQANYDSLTDLPNRNLFRDRLSQAITRATRSSTLLALMFIDLDRFKWVNDTLGHSSGDLLLRMAADRLRHCVRQSDTVARLGGDEFTVLLLDISKPRQAEKVAEEILAALAKPFNIEGNETFVSGSIGITIFPNDGIDAEKLLKNADSAMYKAKEEGRNRYHFFTLEMNIKAVERIHLSNDLRRALEKNSLALHFQPVFDIHTGLIVSAEALLRWSHPVRGWVPPAKFIPLAEESGLAVPLGKWVLKTACTQAGFLLDKKDAPIPISINISARYCRLIDCIANLRWVNETTGWPLDLMTFEITENFLMEDNYDLLAENFLNLRKTGVHLCLDDFGTGYSALAHLKRFPIDSLKIDLSFIHDLKSDPESTILVEAIIAMAHRLKIKVIAEGVETEAQLNFLRKAGCDMAQGFYFTPAMPAEDLKKMLRDNKAPENSRIQV